jgi:lambda family phage minor tail protein L
MKHPSVASAIEKQRVASNVAFIVLLEVDVINVATSEVERTIRICKNPEAISWGGYTWDPSAFEFSVDFTADGVPEANVSISDHKKMIQSEIDKYQGGVGFRVVLRIVDSTRPDQDAELQEIFFVVSTKASGNKVDFKLGSSNPLRQTFPRRTQYSDRCGWRYKDEHCRYAGTLATCDYTLQGDNGCAAHGNVENFGGFPGVRRR